jgi:hypothetical protein
MLSDAKSAGSVSRPWSQLLVGPLAAPYESDGRQLSPYVLKPMALELDPSAGVCFYAFMRTTVEFPMELFRRAKARAASRGESLKTLITRAVAAEVGQEAPATARGRMTLPLFGNPKGRRVDVRAVDIAQALADDDVVRSVGRRRR